MNTKENKILEVLQLLKPMVSELAGIGPKTRTDLGKSLSISFIDTKFTANDIRRILWNHEGRNVFGLLRRTSCHYDALYIDVHSATQISSSEFELYVTLRAGGFGMSDVMFIN